MLTPRDQQRIRNEESFREQVRREVAAKNQQADTKLKTREEYLLGFGQGLLTALPDIYKTMDGHLLKAYALAGALVIFNWKSATAFVFFGATLSVSSDQIFLLVPLVVALLYFLITFQLFRLAQLYRSLGSAGNDLRVLNPQARPIMLADMQLFETGIAGLVLALARWQATKLLRRNPFASPRLGTPDGIGAFGWSLALFAYRVTQWAGTLLARGAILLFLLLMPVILAADVVVSHAPASLTSSPSVSQDLMLILIVSVLVVSAGVLTFVFTLVLFSVCFVELLEGVKTDAEESARAILRSAAGVLLKLVMNTILRPLI